ncbi:hypothetical protein UFOVP49_51 [uncultured Caudovirales phage]|uniref:Uncharacterized protein n=1 Tax=uncultured Caudovirales phage TaxID=2100421 RepID=A0A6J5KW32_9CAUD|nr:hypothetical protein UFOVP49_51 [uncultured Caudovirales phage]
MGFCLDWSCLGRREASSASLVCSHRPVGFARHVTAVRGVEGDRHFLATHQVDDRLGQVTELGEVLLIRHDLVGGVASVRVLQSLLLSDLLIRELRLDVVAVEEGFGGGVNENVHGGFPLREFSYSTQSLYYYSASEAIAKTLIVSMTYEPVQVADSIRVFRVD